MNGAQTIAALATPPGKGAIAIVRTSGPEAPALAARLFRTRTPLRHRVAAVGEVLDERGECIDRGLAIYHRKPHSYTGEESVEFHVHGSPVVVREILRALLACGARQAQPGEFTRRAFLNGKLDLHAAAAVAQLIDAETRSAARAALANLGGGLASEVRELRAQLAALDEDLAAAIDFPDEVAEPPRETVDARVERCMAALERLRAGAETGRLVREGVTVAIVGPPNAGKSSLLNALLGDERALVSEIAGTTRDTIEERVAIDGVPVRLIDTAGIREHADRLEAAGMERTRRALGGARTALVVLDGSQPLREDARAVLALTAGHARIVYCNKADLSTAGAREVDLPEKIVGSVRDAATIEALRAAIATAGWGGEAPDVERPHLAAVRELEAVNAALAALERARATLRSGDPLDFIAGDLHAASAQLGHLTGEAATEALLDGIFSRFCIGK